MTDPFPWVAPDGSRYGDIGEGGGWAEAGENAGHWVELGGVDLIYQPREV